MGLEPVRKAVVGPRVRVVAAAAAAAVLLGVLTVAALDQPVDPGGTVAVSEPEQAGDSQAAGPATPTAQPTPTWEGPAVPPIDMKLAQGAQSAPVTIVEFGDFTCASCGQFARTVEPALRRRYIDTGVVRLFWRDFPAQGRESTRAAIAARAAAEQDMFWPFHDALYADQSSFTDERLRSLAGRVGLDVARFDADRRDPALRRAVEQDFAFGAQLGVPGTPAFLINGEVFFGAQPLAKFVAAIEKARTRR
ncbi:DsbA family protein [Nonomuraea muscovyensis]|uniref:Protein-disulfide isomerase n=1 Tax=Nonomuraea muscovyensis TaxID=1124761 RepID=A0A7X0C4C0_9ACTN|nr:thioredoxin domain-containing protein [Nonomuraea muscovyensis]MBB6347205.1 protein-disulfide isomerase [Nonomuraea muscovyensis]MDF2709395.1 thioredoxin protein [Nonomuraea muscovyensis]